MSDEYDAAVAASMTPNPAQSARVGFSAAADTNPDAYAEAQRVARRTGVPVDTVFAMPNEIKRQDQMGSINFDSLAKTSPATAALLADIEKAKIAHDDVGNLSMIEDALYSLGKFEVGTGRAIASAVPKFNEGMWGIARAGAETFIPEVLGRKPIADFFARQGAKSRAVAGQWMPKADGMIESSWYSGMQSLGLNAILLPVSLASGGSMTPMLTGMGLSTGGSAYGEARDKSVPVAQALAFGTSQGVIEAGTEMIGMPALFSILKPGQFARKAAEYMVKEQGGEQIATHLQDLNEWAVLHPEKTLSDYLHERPGAAVQTALATAFGGGGQVALMKGVEILSTRNDIKVDNADKTLELLGRLNEMATASKVLGRDATTFEQHVQSVADNGPAPEAVYISAQTLQQSGIADQVAMLSPAVAAQLDVALQTGGDIRIPVGEYAANIATTEYAPTLVDHLKFDAEGFSRAEAQTYMQEKAPELQAEVDRVLGEQSADETWKASAQEVEDAVFAELQNAGRFTESVNRTDAVLHKAFASVMAAKLGVTPMEFFKAHTLRVMAERVDGAQFDQAGNLQIDTPQFKTWFGESKVVGADGKPLVVYHGTTSDFTEFKPNVALGGGMFFSPDQKEAGAFASAQGANVMPVYLKAEKVWPKIVRSYDEVATIKKAQAAGYDAVRVRDAAQGIVNWVVFNPTQIKSAIGNNGNFNPNDANILHQQNPDDFLAQFDNADTINIEPLAMSEQEKDDAQTAFLSTRQEGTTKYGRKSGIARRIRRASDNAANTIGEDPRTTRTVESPLGPFSGYEVIGVVLPGDEQYNPGGVLKVRIYGKEQVEQGLMDEPALTFTVMRDGELSVNGPVPGGKTFEEFQNRGWAEQSKAGEQIAEGWSNLTNPDGKPLPISQNIALLADVHARVRAWKTDELTGLHWSRATGALAALGDHGSAMYFQPAYHGSPYKFDKFSLEHLGKGEGAQAYGWGLYFAGEKKVAEWYRDKLKPGSEILTWKAGLIDLVRNGEFRDYSPRDGSDQQQAKALLSEDLLIRQGDVLAAYDKEGLAGAKRVMQEVADDRIKMSKDDQPGIVRYLNVHKKRIAEELVLNVKKDEGQLYEVDIPDDGDMLLWDEPLSEQPENVKSALADLVGAMANWNHGGVTYPNPSILSGEGFYRALEQEHGSDEAASKYLNSLGIRGIKYRDGNSRGGQVKNYNYVIFDDSAIDILQTYYQGDRGSFNPDTNTIALLKNADLSTFLHESGHFFLEVQTSVANQLAQDAAVHGVDTLNSGERQILDDQNALLAWFGVKDLAEWNNLSFEEKRAYHEQFARGFEAYLFEGKAPSIELHGVFQRFRAWLLNVYKSLTALNVELTPEVRGVFDRMLATTEQIQLAEQSRSMMPLFERADQAGMTLEEFAAYQANGIDASNTAIEELQARGLRDMQWLHNARGRVIKQLQKESAARRAEVRMDAKREIMSQPVYQAWEFLTGKTKDGAAAVVDGEDGLPYSAHGKIDRSHLANMGLPAEVTDRLDKLRMVKRDALHPDIIADMFGFSSGDEMVRALATVDKPNDTIEGLTDQRMLEQYGDLSSQREIEKAADQAVHNDVRARMVATEANALAKATGKPKILAEAAKAFASAMIARLKVRNLTPGQYASAEVRASKAAAKASKAGDIETAAAEKRNQLINSYATRAAYDAQTEVEKALRYLKKFDSAIKGLDPEYTTQIDALLERFDLRKKSNVRVDKMTALAAWAESQRDQGLEPEIPPDLLNEAFRKSYKDMTVEEFRGLVDTVKQIEHLGRLKHKLLTAKDQRAYEVVRDEIVASIVEHGQNREANTRTPTTNAGRVAQSLKRFWASHIKAATWARVMDGGKDGGPMWEYFVRVANERGDFETTERAKATEALTKILAPVLAMGKMGGSGQFFPSIKRSLNREAKFAIALNVGNEGNLQRLLGGEGWTEAQLMPVLQTLTPQEWQAVQAVWDHFDGYRPQIAAKELRVYGKEPEWVNPGSEVSAQFGLRGGYYPIKYDPAASQRAEEHADAEGAKRQVQGAYTTATTRRSFTKSRAEEVQGRPLLYTLSGLYSGVNDVIHDLAWHEWLIDTNRLLRSKSIDGAIRNIYGPEVKQQFKTWSQDIAEGDKGAADAGEAAIARLRQGVSIAGLGFNVMSAAIQPLGLTQSIVRVGAGYIGRGVTKYLANPIAASREANEKSSFMENRARTRFRELNELRNQVQDGSATKELVGRYAYFLMMRCQQVVDVPTWHGAYEKAIGEGNNEERAIGIADQAVIDAQGGGQTKDLSAIERGGPALRLFTVFYSFMNTALNLGVAQGMAANTPAKKAKLASDYLLLYVIPPILGYLLKNALTPGDSGDDDLDKLAKKLAANQIDYLMGLMFVTREFSGAAKTAAGLEDYSRGYSGPAGVRVISDAYTLAMQVKQGEFDDAFRKALINTIGGVAGLPSAQINRTITGAEALHDGETGNPAALVFGFQKKH